MSSYMKMRILDIKHNLQNYKLVVELEVIQGFCGKKD